MLPARCSGVAKSRLSESKRPHSHNFYSSTFLYFFYFIISYSLTVPNLYITSQHTHVCAGKNILYKGFGTIHSSRHPLGVLEHIHTEKRTTGISPPLGQQLRKKVTMYMQKEAMSSVFPNTLPALNDWLQKRESRGGWGKASPAPCAGRATLVFFPWLWCFLSETRVSQ